MTLIRFIQRASLLSSLVVTSLIIHGSPARSDQRVCIITDDGATMCGKPTSSKKEAKNPKQQNPGYQKEVDNFIYLLKGCRKSDTTVKCELSIINKGTERSTYIHSALSSFIDPTGKLNTASTADIGGIYTGNGNNQDVQMTPGIVYSASITFSNVSDQIANAQVLKLHVVNDKDVQFRNVPFSN